MSSAPFCGTDPPDPPRSGHERLEAIDPETIEGRAQKRYAPETDAT
jgi:hypothetical protein